MEARKGKGKRESVRPRNFMSMSDDEEEEDEMELDEDQAMDVAENTSEENREGGRLLSVLCEEEGVVVPSASLPSPLPSPSFKSTSQSAPASTSPSPSPSRSKRSSLSLSHSLSHSSHSVAPSRRTSLTSNVETREKRSRRGTLESLFAPLANFMDLRDDDLETTKTEESMRKSEKKDDDVE